MSELKQLRDELAEVKKQVAYLDGRRNDSLNAFPIRVKEEVELATRQLRAELATLRAENERLSQEVIKANGFILKADQEDERLRKENEALMAIAKSVNWWLNQDRFGRPCYSIVFQKPNKFWLCWVKPDLTLEKNLGPTTTNALSLILLAYRHHLKNKK